MDDGSHHDAAAVAAGRSRFLRKVMTELPAALPLPARAELLRAVREYLDAEPPPGDGSSEPDAVRALAARAFS